MDLCSSSLQQYCLCTTGTKFVQGGSERDGRRVEGGRRIRRRLGQALVAFLTLTEASVMFPFTLRTSNWAATIPTEVSPSQEVKALTTIL